MAKVITSSYVLEESDSICLVDSSAGPLTITLPQASARTGSEIKLVRVNPGNSKDVTITPLADGDKLLKAQYDSIIIISVGNQWVTYSHKVS